MLTKKYGSPTSGWRSYLDPDAHGKLSFLEFCTAVRAIGYTGSLKKLWAEFELGPGSFITLAHLDPDADRLLESFFDHLEKKHGNVLTAWTKAFDTHGSGHVEKELFVERCRALGFPGSPLS